MIWYNFILPGSGSISISQWSSCKEEVKCCASSFLCVLGSFSLGGVTSGARVMNWPLAAATHSSQLPIPHSGTINPGFHPHNEFPAAQWKLHGFLLSADNRILAVVLISHDTCPEDVIISWYLSSPLSFVVSSQCRQHLQSLRLIFGSEGIKVTIYSLVSGSCIKPQAP